MKPRYLLPAMIALLLLFGSVWGTSLGPARPEADSRDSYAHRSGRREAKAARDRGEFVVVSFGLPAAWTSEYQRVLWSEYGIEHRAIAGCVVSEGLLDYANDFNAVMEAAIEARHGRDVFDRAAEKARTLFDQRTVEAETSR